MSQGIPYKRLMCREQDVCVSSSEHLERVFTTEKVEEDDQRLPAHRYEVISNVYEGCF